LKINPEIDLDENEEYLLDINKEKKLNINITNLVNIISIKPNIEQEISFPLSKINL